MDRVRPVAAARRVSTKRQKADIAPLGHDAHNLKVVLRYVEQLRQSHAKATHTTARSDHVGVNFEAINEVVQ
jgi:hypothetical protein